MFIHFSILSGLVVPFAGLIVPIILWQVKKEDAPAVDLHGRLVVNWIISTVIYGAICFILSFVFIGLLGFLALALVNLVFPIIGGIKANHGELWRYPLTLTFLK